MWLGESGRRVSNPLPTAWKAVALPNELLPLFLCGRGRIRTSEDFVNRFTVCPIWPLWNSPKKKEPVDGFEPPTS